MTQEEDNYTTSKFRPKMGAKKTKKHIRQYASGPASEYKEASGRFPKFVFKNKKLVFIDTKNWEYDYDKGASPEAMMPKMFMDHTTFILEMPLYSGKVSYAENDDNKVKTELMRYAMGTAGRKNNMICADGKSVYDGHGKLHRMLKLDNHAPINEAEISEERIQSLASRYLDKVLIKKSSNVSQFVSEVTDMTGKLKGISPEVVMQRTTDRVIQLISGLPVDERTVMKEVVMKELVKRINEKAELFIENLEDLDDEEEVYREELREQVAEEMPKQKLLGKRKFGELVAELEKELEHKLYKKKAIMMKNYDVSILGELENVLSFVLLLAEIAGTNSGKVVMVYPSEYLRPLKRMIHKFEHLNPAKTKYEYYY
ncbi:MAG: hypothetical protein AAGA66_15820 [Bacteroidota bacterium]